MHTRAVETHEILVGNPVSHQVVFAGPFGVGKTTALRVLSEIPVLDTDRASAEANAAARAGGKTSTTVAFDYGEFTLATGKRVGLLGLPGQHRFEAMWDRFIPGSTAVVLWLFGDKTLDDAVTWLRELGQRRQVLRLAVAVSRLPAGREAVGLAPFRALLAQIMPLAEVTAADPREEADVRRVVTLALRASPGIIMEC